MGEVVIADNTLTGAGVVLAQRLEQLAEADGVCIQGAAYETIPSQLPFAFEPLGEQIVKGFEQPVRAFAVRLTPGQAIPLPERSGRNRHKWFAAAAVLFAVIIAGGLVWFQPWVPREEPASVERMAYPLPDKPSIAVLPFANMSGDPEQDYFSDGISEDIITDLSRLTGLAVIARQSSFAYKGQTVTATDIGKDLGVGYLLEGSVRKAGGRIRITAQLIDTASGHHLWAERYDRLQGDIFALQDDIKRRIVDALSVRLRREEDRDLTRVTKGNFEAYDSFLQGRRNFSRQTVEGFKQAIEDYRRAIDLDPEFARAYGALATTYVRLAFSGGSDAPVEHRERGMALARTAVAIDAASAQVQWALGFANLHMARFDEARAAARKSIELSPSYADAYLLLALINNYLGRGQEALEWATRAWELNPHATWDYPYNVGRAYYNLGEYAKAVAVLKDAVERNEENYLPRLWLAASYVRLGRQDDAEWEVDQIEMLVPDLTFDDLFRGPIDDGGARERLRNDLRAAGLPD